LAQGHLLKLLQFVRAHCRFWCPIVPMVAFRYLAVIISLPLLATSLSSDALNSTVAGSYKVEYKRYSYQGMDRTDKTIDVWYPVGSAGQKFPFISYAHGNTFGGGQTVYENGKIITDMAAFGYVIAAPQACNTGCSDGATVPGGPRGFKNFYEQQLKVIDWAKQQASAGDAVFETVNFDIGVGVSGHSMGGQATLVSASGQNPSKYNIKAAVMHHAYTHEFPAANIPFLAFTGTADYIAPSSMTTEFFNARGASSTRGLVNKVGATHLESNPMNYNPKLASFTVAWFKVFLDKTPQSGGVDFHGMIFGKDKSSLCGGGDGSMAQCTILGGSSEVLV
jgi:dienelactone hydrolase